jgi:hypothetical protein
MFPTFDVPPQHSETVGARKARRANLKDDDTKRSSSTASQSSGSAISVTASSRRPNAPRTHSDRSTEKSGFGGWFGKKKGIQEITPLPTNKTSHPTKDLTIELETGLELELEGPAPPTAPLDTQPHVRSRPSSHRSDCEPPAPLSQRFPLPPPLKSLPLPSPPPLGGLPPAPAPGLLSPVIPGTCMTCATPRQRGSHEVATATLGSIGSIHNDPQTLCMVEMCLHKVQTENHTTPSLPVHRQTPQARLTLAGVSSRQRPATTPLFQKTLMMTLAIRSELSPSTKARCLSRSSEVHALEAGKVMTVIVSTMPKLLYRPLLEP